MSQHSCVHTLLSHFWLRSLLVQSLSWLGVFSLLSSNLVLAQTSPDVVVAPAAVNSKPQAVIPAPTSSTPQSVPNPARLKRLQQRLSATPTPVITRPRVTRQKVATPAPQTSVPMRVAKPQTQSPRLAPTQRPQLTKKTPLNTATDYNNAYIDPTNYSVGATRNYEAPNAVVLSERSTGCRATLRQGQGLSGSICGTTRQQRTRLAVRGQQYRTVQLPRPQSPLGVRSSMVARSKISPIRVGPISVTTNGFSAARRTPVAVQGQIAYRSVPFPVQQRTPYYNPSLTPTYKPGSLNTGLMFPLTIPATITSIFGWRIHPITGNSRFHSGTDLGAPLGTPVLSAYAGHVSVADFLGGYGLTVVLDHSEFTQQTLYAHLSEIFVQPGEWVEQGTVIGRVGSTGNSTGPHLHFETRQLTPEGWVATDPGIQIENALAQLVEALRVTQSSAELPAS